MAVFRRFLDLWCKILETRFDPVRFRETAFIGPPAGLKSALRLLERSCAVVLGPRMVDRPRGDRDDPEREQIDQIEVRSANMLPFGKIEFWNRAYVYFA